MLKAMPWRAFSCLLVLAVTARADDLLPRVLQRLAEQAATFQRVAPDLVAQEKLQQRALKSVKRHFSPHFTGSNNLPVAPEFQTREIVSEYGFATLDGGIREFRKPVSVDEKDVPDRGQALSRLAAGIRTGDESSKRSLLEDFEKLGLIGTVTDFGQLLLLFDARGQENYEFSVGETRLVGADRVITINYRQTDGAPSLTVWREGKANRQRTSGEILVRASDLLPVRITIAAVTGQGTRSIREEAEVDYNWSEFGALVPVSVIHREFHADRLTSENRFTYSTFRRFGSSSLIRFPDPGGLA